MAYTLQISDQVLASHRIGNAHNNRDGSISHCLGFEGYHDTQTINTAEISGIVICSDGAWEPLTRNTHKNNAGQCFEVPLNCDWEASKVCSLLLSEADRTGLTGNATLAVACW